MKTRKEIATILLKEAKNTSSGNVFSAKIKEALGSNAYSEALRLRWLQADLDMGGVKLSTSGIHVAEMRDSAYSNIEESCDNKLPSHFRKMCEASFGGGGTAGTSTGSIGTTQAATTLPVSTSVSSTTSADVGKQVEVVEGGKVYRGAVKSKHPDGTYEISFSSSSNPGAASKKYKKEEIKFVNVK